MTGCVAFSPVILVAAFVVSGVTAAEKANTPLHLTLTVEDKAVPARFEAVIKVTLTNEGTEAVDIPFGLLADDSGSLGLWLKEETQSRQLPLRIWNEYSVVAPDINLKPSAQESSLLHINMDWRSAHKAVFEHPGEYRFYTTLYLSKEVTLTSNEVVIKVREPDAPGERAAHDALANEHVLACFFCPNYITIQEDARHVAQTVRKLYEMRPITIYHAQAEAALGHFKKIQRSYSDSMPNQRLAKDMRDRQLDNLGILDLKLPSDPPEPK
jgi:hypothetical protein